MIKIVTGQKLIDISKSVIREINEYKNNLSMSNIIVVPDRFSLLAEKMVFETLNIKSSFNIHVMGITALAKNIISQAGIDCVYLNNDECKFILFRALQKCKKDFECFSKNISQGLCQKIQNILSLIRSSDVDSNMLMQASENVEMSTALKLKDLSSINNEYENLLAGRLDGTNTLKLFTHIIEQNVNFQTTNFYFCGFDAFTKQGYEIVKNICKVANNVSIGCFCPNNNKNSAIFDNEMLNNLKNILQQENLQYKLEPSFPILSLPQKELFENIYGGKIEQSQDFDYVKVLELATMQDEIKMCANKIISLTKLKKCKYSDISIITSSEYFDTLKSTFDKYNISYYLDASKQFYNTEICNFIRYVLDVKNTNFDQESLLNLINNYFVFLDKETKNDIENYIIENDIEYTKIDKLFEEFDLKDFGEILNQIKTFDKNTQIQNFIEKLDNLLQKAQIEQKITYLCEHFAKNNDLFNQKLYSQVLDKIKQINEELKKCIDENLCFEEFYELYLGALKDIKISQVPLSADSVFVGDASSSFFEKTKYYFVLGANQDVLLKPTKDLALLSDKEIEDLDKIIKISPTSKMINRRTKFKLFDLLTNASEKIYISYHLQDNEGKKVLCSQFVNDILSLCGKSSKISQNDIYEKYVDDEISKTMFLCPNVYESIKNLNDCNQDVGLIRQSLIEMGINLEYGKQNHNTISKGEQIIKNNETKISQIESYYKCPFSHFAKYGLKLQEQKTAKIEANEFGNFLHEFAKIYIDQNNLKLGQLTDEQTEQKVEDVLQKLLNKIDYKKLLNKENEISLCLLTKEAKRYAKFLNFEAQNSDFHPYKTEYKFNDNNIFVLVNNKKYKIVGIIDRIDKCDDYFRIIDYKTGLSSKQNSSLKNVYYGTKIQVYVYLYATQKLFNLKPFGAFYLPIVQSYGKAIEDNEEDYKMHGYFLGEPSIVERADKTFNINTKVSKLFDAKYSAKSTIENKKFVYSKNLTKQELDNITNYSLEIVRQGIKEILDGNIKASPIEEECKFCKFKAICGIDAIGVSARKCPKIDKQSFERREQNDGQ